jgi:hypothetical protein
VSVIFWVGLSVLITLLAVHVMDVARKRSRASRTMPMVVDFVVRHNGCTIEEIAAHVGDGWYPAWRRCVDDQLITEHIAANNQRVFAPTPAGFALWDDAHPVSSEGKALAKKVKSSLALNLYLL